MSSSYLSECTHTKGITENVVTNADLGSRGAQGLVLVSHAEPARRSPEMYKHSCEYDRAHR